MVDFEIKDCYKFDDLLRIMEILRAPDGCMWDREQDHHSIRRNFIEETYEVCEAIDDEDTEHMKEELGDVLLQVVFHTQMEKEKGTFNIDDVADGICKKLIYRHPHVFGDASADTAKKVEQSWEQLKLKEKGGNKTVLEGVPASLPSVVKAHRIQDKARNVGFDWEQRDQVWDKVHEEFTELKEEIDKMDADKMEGEFGDLFFSLINAARLYKINPDNALERTNQKFIRRFNYLEDHTIKEGRSLKDMPLEEMDKIWNEAKSKGL